MVLNAAVQMLKEADDLKLNITKFKSGTSMLQDRNLWATQQQLQKVYQKVLVLDLDYALDKKVEQDLWNIGFKQQIEALQAISKDRKNPGRSEGQAMLSWVLQAAAGFYLGLLHQICTTFKLDLPFRRRASLLGSVEGWGVSEAPPVSGAKQPPPAAARYIAQHCLVHLGDLARYRHQLRVAHTFYRHAVVVSAHSGQPYNQLALVAWRRGRRLAAIYWHVRSLLVRTPFPPAPANLARTLAAAAASSDSRDLSALPVLPGLTAANQRAPDGLKAANQRTAAPLDSSTHISHLIRALHHIHTLHDLETATQLVDTLNSSLTALVATDSFEPNALIKMACVIIWLVHWSTDDCRVTAAALSSAEQQASVLSGALAGGALLALLLPAYTRPQPPPHTLPALKVWLHWVVLHRQVLCGAAFAARPQLWPALAHALNQLAATNSGFRGDLYESLPLPEDDELVGFLPLEGALAGLKFAEHATWDSYGDRIPDFAAEGHNDDAPDANSDVDSSPSELTQIALMNEPELESKVRAYRLLQLGKKLVEIRPDMLTLTVEDDKLTFAATALGGEQLSAALAELSLAASGRDEPAPHNSPAPPPAPAHPVVISEADFREKVREKRVGILKPQGSLERAREERAGAASQQDQDTESVEDSAKGEDSAKEATRKTRMNVAMAAIMRKQEETNKQVKFVTPPPTADVAPESADASTSTKDADKAKIVQPKAVKSLANLPIGRKTGGILSLKDKSAGYPHLVNTDPEPAKKPEKEEKKDAKSSQLSQNSQQNYVKKQDHQPAHNWTNNAPMPQQNYGENPRFSLHKNAYGIQNTGLNYNPNYQAPINNQGIRLPVVNPKEIDVRSAALQKQNSRLEPYMDGHKFGSQGYQNISGDKKNFMNDLPPRFANQYRHWQNSQENQFSNQDNKFRDQNFQPSNSLFGSNQPARPANWMMNPPLPDNFHPSVPWWKPDNPPPQTNFNSSFAAPPLTMPPSYFSPQNMANPYQQNLPSYQPMGQQLSQQLGQLKQDNLPSYSIGQPLQGLPNLQSFNSNFSTYTPSGGYDANMYPQFNKMGFQQSPLDKPLGQYGQGKELMDMGLGFGSNVRRSVPAVNFNEPMHTDVGTAKSLDQIGAASDKGSVETQGSTYSLFSGADSAAWGSAQAPPQQSLWSGPGPSPLERLLEQQKQLKHPPEPQ